MEKLPARTGWLWIKDGIALFRKQPAEVSTLFLSYMFLMIVLGLIPVIGQLLPLILVPVFAMAFMHACVQIEQDKRVFPKLLLVGFRSPALRRLLALGVLYMLAAFTAVTLSSLVDGGTFLKAMTSPAFNPEEVSGGNILLAMIVAALAYIPAAMAFWFAAPLIMWQQMPLGKALFFSFFAVLRAGKAFLTYGLIWVLSILLPTFFITFVALWFGDLSISMFILLPLSIILTVVMYCSFYTTYTAIFGRPTTAALSAADQRNAS